MVCLLFLMLGKTIRLQLHLKYLSEMHYAMITIAVSSNYSGPHTRTQFLPKPTETAFGAGQIDHPTPCPVN
jgi:hypothetical protein